MRVMVSAASKHGATAEIAEVIGEVLGDRGLDTEVRPPDGIESIDGYDAFVIGSAVYAGHWLKEAVALIENHGSFLRNHPVWLFSSGPVGEPPKPEEEPVDIAHLLDAIGAGEHRVFGGRLDRSRLGFAEKAIVMALRAPEGDFRDWDEIRAWAAGIAAKLEAPPAAW